MTVRDASEVVRQGLATWWAAQGTLTSLGAVALAADDGSPASSESSLPNVTARISDFVLDQTSNNSEYWSGDVTFEVQHNSSAEAYTACEPLDTLLEAMIRTVANLPAMPRGYLTEFRVVRSRMTQIDPMLWRADRECRCVLVLPR